MFSRDGISGLVCFAISVLLLVQTFYLPPAAIVTIGPAFYPRIVLTLLGLLSVILIVMDFRAMRALQLTAGPAPATASGAAPNYRLVLITFITFGLYIFLLPRLGFRISTFLFVMALQVALDWPRSSETLDSRAGRRRGDQPGSVISSSRTTCRCCCRAEPGAECEPLRTCSPSTSAWSCICSTSFRCWSVPLLA